MAEFECLSLLKGFDFTIPPFFKDIDFWFWKARMTSFIKATDFYMWNVIINDFDFKPRKDWTEKEKQMFSLNIRAMKILYRALTEKDYVKVKCCSSAKDIWDTLDSIYASNNCVEVESVDSSSKTVSCVSTTDEQLEMENEEGEIIECFNNPVNTEQEEDDSQEELMDNYDQTSSRAQEAHVVNNSNSSCVVKKNDFELLHKIVFQPTDSVLKNKNVFNHAGKSYVKEEYTNMTHSILHPLTQHNSCKTDHNKHHPIICNYCGKSGHISHTCCIRRNSTMRNKFVWVPKGQSMSNANSQGPKYKWVPKRPSSALCVQDNLKSNGHNGTNKRKKKPRVSHASTRMITTSISKRRTLEASIARTTRSKHQKKQWIQTRGVCSTSRMDYHRVPFNYLEENMKKRRISQVSNKRLLKSISSERALPTSTRKYMKNQWVSKAKTPST